MDRASRHAAEDKLAVLLAPDEGETAATKDKVAHAQILLSSAVRRTFSDFDIDRSGALAVEELAPFLEALGSRPLDEEELQRAFDELDHDQSGLIEYDEFLPWWRSRGLRYVFDKHDLDCSGSIDAEEFHNVALELGLKLTVAEEADALRKLDTSGDGKIGYDEYASWFEILDMQIEFDKYDHDKSGTVNRREFLQLTTSLGLSLTKRERDRVFASLDVDRSGVISFEEFHPWFKSVRVNMKQFILGKVRWEDDLFLSRVDNAQREAEETMQSAVSKIGKEIEEGKPFTRAEIIRRVCGGSTTAILAHSVEIGARSPHRQSGAGASPSCESKH